MCPHTTTTTTSSLEDESRQFLKGQTANLMILAMLDGLKRRPPEDEGREFACLASSMPMTISKEVKV
jgi:hypothetical protein